MSNNSTPNGRFRDPWVYALTLLAFLLGGGSGTLLDAGAPGAPGDVVQLVQHEIDRAVRPIEADLQEIKAEVRVIRRRLEALPPAVAEESARP